MKVYGYTEDKDVVGVDLSIDEIVSAGIDPWRLDLFDRSPVVWAPRGRQLHFRKLQDLSFAYRRDDDSVFVGLHDGDKQQCISATEYMKHRDMWLRLKDIKASEVSFAEHFREYLKRLTSDDQQNECEMGVASGPRSASALAMRTGGLIFNCNETPFDWDHDDAGVWFTGEMFDSVSLGVTLPREVNWILQELAPWSPVVVCDGLRQALSGARVTEVRFRVDCHVMLAAKHFLQGKHQLDWPSYETGFRFSGCRYLMEELDTRVDALAEKFDYSVDGLKGSQIDRVEGTRIALFDTGKRQARQLFRIGPNAGTELKRIRLADDGFKVITPVR